MRTAPYGDTAAVPASARYASPIARSFKLTLVTLCVVAVSASPARAAGNGSGTFSGVEYAPSATLIMPSALCARFDPTGTGSRALVHELQLSGTLHGASGTGTGTFTNDDTAYQASPEGTFADTALPCTTPAAVPGEMTIDFGAYHCTTAEDAASYQRHATSSYTLQFSGTCDDTTTTGDDAIPTNATFTGTQVPCPPASCAADPNADAEMSGAYVQTH